MRIIKGLFSKVGMEPPKIVEQDIENLFDTPHVSFHLHLYDYFRIKYNNQSGTHFIIFLHRSVQAQRSTIVEI